MKRKTRVVVTKDDSAISTFNPYSWDAATAKMAVGAPAERMTQVIIAGSDTKRRVRP